MARLVIHFDWRYLSILYQEGDFGNSGRQEVLHELGNAEQSTSVIYSTEVGRSLKQDEIDAIFAAAWQTGAPAMIFWLVSDVIAQLMQSTMLAPGLHFIESGFRTRVTTR